jgi:hypothetical protein
VRAALGLFQPLLEQREALGQDLRLVGQARDGGREVQQQQQDERERDEEQRVGRVGDADRVGQALEAVAPRGEAEQDDRAEQPQQRVALEQTPAAHELQHDEQQDGRADDRDELDPLVHQTPVSAATGAAPPGSGSGRRRNSPTNSASRTLTM